MWKDNLERSVGSAKARVIGHGRVEYAQHAVLVTTALAAFGDDPRATFFIEGVAPGSNIPRPDLIILHPEVGVLVIENKGMELGQIHAATAGNLVLERNGQLKEEDPLHQAEKVMFRLLDFCKERFDISDALFLRTAAFPRIRRDEFERRLKCQMPPETLFIDACTDPAAFRQQVLTYARIGQQKAGKAHRLSRIAHDQILSILVGSAIFQSPRKSYVTETDERLLGVQIQKLELAIKEATQQQRDLDRTDLLGAHRLFRGVAGSGKSIMLAMSVAKTLAASATAPAGLFGKQPTARVLVVCFNRTLVHYLRSKIEDRYGRLTWDTPPKDWLTVTHFEGLVRDVESGDPRMQTNLTWEQKAERAKALCAQFDRLPASSADKLQYDAVYVDEAQDLLPAELEFLRRLARRQPDGGQSLVVFYDNAQNIYGVTPPTWGDLGINIVGRTVFLDLCLRNTRETLAFAFNVLVGSFASEGQKVTTRQFADVAGLKQRGLISENGDRYDIHFSPRTGPQPRVSSYPTRRAEIDGTVAAIETLVKRQRVLPRDILVLHKSHHSFKGLAEGIARVIGSEHQIRQVDAEHFINKNHPLVEDGYLTVSTIASAKGYDAPIVFLLGADELATDTQGRASFYVGATRAKLLLYVSGVMQPVSGLLEEILLTSKALVTSPTVKVPPVAPLPATTQRTPLAHPTPTVAVNGNKRCRHCGSQRLHAQHGRFGYFFRCIDCTGNTPIDVTCPKCGEKGRIRKDGLKFYLECERSQFSAVIHINTPLDRLEG